MKIRMGFVSNSSSTSFCVYGGELDDEQVQKIIEAHGKIFTNEKYEDEETLGEILHDLKSKVKIIYTPDGWDGILIGRDFDSIGDDETGGQFKTSIEKELKELTGEDIKCGKHEEAWRDG